jgi:hypothetical protein
MQQIERGRGWPWNGYELRLMKDAGKYPPPAWSPASSKNIALVASSRLCVVLEVARI